MALAMAHGLKVGVISDMHTNTLYEPDVSASAKCWNTSTSEASDHSPWARYGCDPSIDLVDAMLKRFNEKFGKPDILLVSGDHICHGISPHRDEVTQDSYQAVKDNITATNEIVKKHFSDTLVITVLGNNDAQYHD